MGIISTISLLFPIAAIIYVKLYNYRSFPALMIYYGLTFIANLFYAGFLHSDSNVALYYSVLNSIVSTSLMLMFMTYFSTSPLFTRRMHLLIAIFAGLELMILAVYGFTTSVQVITMGAGIAVVLMFALVFFIRQTRITIMHRKAAGKALITSAILFAYGCYAIVFTMYFLLNYQHPDTFLIYFLITTTSALLISAGIIVEKKRIRKLAELKITRRELLDLYEKENAMSPLKARSFDFDREQWN